MPEVFWAVTNREVSLKHTPCRDLCARIQLHTILFPKFFPDKCLEKTEISAACKTSGMNLNECLQHFKNNPLQREKLKDKPCCSKQVLGKVLL